MLLLFTTAHSIHARYLRKIYIGFGLIFMAMTIGITGFMLLEGYTFTEALYMTIITVSTVGFKEVHDLSEAGRLFTAFLIVSNIGIFAYAVTTVTSFILEGEYRYFFQDYTVNKQINQLKEHIVICGYGRLGKRVAEELIESGELFLVIEKEEGIVAHLRKEQQVLYMEGDATKDEVLQKARLSEAKALITTLPSDADNVFVTLTAKSMNTELLIISRASDEASEAKLQRAGANYVIMPEHIGGNHIASLITQPDINEFINRLTGRGGVSISFEEFPFEELPSSHQNKTIKSLDVRGKTGANIIGLRTPEGEYLINPSPDTTLAPNTKLIILGTEEQREQFKERILKQ